VCESYNIIVMIVCECLTNSIAEEQFFLCQTSLSCFTGPVSVQQQLQIMARMARTYPFLKVVSTGVALDISRFVQ
jgi:hypothetical protein